MHWLQLASERPLPGRPTIAIRHGTVLTASGDGFSAARADILVRDGTIVEVAGTVEGAGAEDVDATGMIVMPGMIDSHYHMWSTIGRNFVADSREYYAAKSMTAAHYAPDDFYRSVALGLVACIDAGITTVNNWSHNTRSIAHADAELAAHARLGVRARYSFGHRDGLASDTALDFDDVDRVHRTWFSTPDLHDGLVTLGVNLRGPNQSDIGVFETEMAGALDRALPVSIHAGQGATKVRASEFASRGWLGPAMLFAHYLRATDEDRAAMVDAGTSLSYAPHSELRLGRSPAVHGALIKAQSAGVNVSLSIDATSLGPINMFETMSVAWNLGTPWADTDTSDLAPLSFSDVLGMGTLNGARALGLDHVTGSIEPGKRADLVLVRTGDLNVAPPGDPAGSIVRSASPANVDTVIIDGRVLKRSGRLVGIDVPAVVRDAQHAAAGVWARSTAASADATPDHRSGSGGSPSAGRRG